MRKLYSGLKKWTLGVRANKWPSDRKLWAAGWGRCVCTMTIHSAHLTETDFSKVSQQAAPQLEHSDPPGLGLTLPLLPCQPPGCCEEEGTGRMGWWGRGVGLCWLVFGHPGLVGPGVCRGHCEQDVFALRRWGSGSDPDIPPSLSCRLLPTAFWSAGAPSTLAMHGTWDQLWSVPPFFERSLNKGSAETCWKAFLELPTTVFISYY